MTMQSYAQNSARLNKFKGQVLKRAQPMECLSRGGRQVKFPKNNSDTYVSRRWLPYGATTADPNTFFGTADGDRGQAIVQAHQTQEGITPTPDSISPQDVPVVLQQYSCLYGFTDKTYHLYEDDVPAEMSKMVGERVTLVNEMINYGVLKASTNQFYGGTGTSIATANSFITLGMVRKMSKALASKHGMQVTSVLKASALYATEAVAGGYIVYGSTDLEPDIRDMSGFIPAEKYASGTPMANELGKVERFRFVLTPDFPARLNAGAAVGATGCFSTTGALIDIHSFIVVAEDAWSQVAVRGLESVDPTLLLPGNKDKADPHGQRGYAGAIWWKAAVIENNGWMAVGNVGVRVLS